MNSLTEICQKAKEAAYELNITSTKIKDKALKNMADALISHQTEILVENEKDLEAGRRKKLSSAMLDRLALNSERIKSISQGILDIAALPDPVGEVISGHTLKNGLQIRQVRTPIGVVLMVYEARPNVTVDAATLGLKAGSAVILRGGSESVYSNRILASILANAAESSGCPKNCIQMVPTQEHEAVTQLLRMSEYIDLVIPRGGEKLIKNVAENARMPVIKHFKGLCHIYVDEFADEEKSVKITVNAKAQRPSTCNAAETLLIHNSVAEEQFPKIVKALQEKKVEIRGCKKCLEITPDIKKATEIDWETEYLDLKISVKIVDSLDEALGHIKKYSSGLSEAIITENYDNAQKFLLAVDSAAVYANASTRFTDGGQFGMGSEIGITTDKVFPRGPMGLRELTGSKYIIYGNGQIRT